jgi:cytochrome bd ubiquinol oxidase subunit II
VTLADLWYLLFGAVIAGYVILDGFDLGVGMLHPFVAKSDRERRLSLNSIGPIWDGNEVWLVVGGGVLFAAFPVVYAALFSGFYTALMLVLLCLILRTVSIEFRSKRERPAWRRTWDVIFSASSYGLALLLGVAFGNVISGVPLDGNGDLELENLLDLLHPFALWLGVTTIAMLSLHGALYLNLKVDGELQGRVRRWIPRLAVLFLATGTIAAVWMVVAGYVDDQYERHLWLLAIPLGALSSFLYGVFAFRRGHEARAFFASGGTIALLLASVAAGLFPNMLTSTIKPAYDMTVSNASSDGNTLTVMLVVAVIGMPFVLLYTAGVQYLFRGKVELGGDSY